MKCKTAQSLFNEAVDQRLPQVEAQALQKHLIACPSCRAEYDDLAQLQRWTRDLPEKRVAGDFTSRLMERIAAGEGTPPAVLNMPTPLGARVRHFAYGAGTAAALLLSAFLVFDSLNGNSSGSPSEAFVHAPVAVSTTEIATRAIDKATERFQTLQANAPVIVERFPPRRALEKLALESEDVYWTARLARSASTDAIELPQELSRSLQDIETTCRTVVIRSIDSKDPKRTSEELARLICQPSVPARKTFFRVRVGAPRFSTRWMRDNSWDPEAMQKLIRALDDVLEVQDAQIVFDRETGRWLLQVLKPASGSSPATTRQR